MYVFVWNGENNHRFFLRKELAMKTRNLIQLIVLTGAVICGNAEAGVSISVGLFGGGHRTGAIRGPVGRNHAGPPMAARPGLHLRTSIIPPIYAGHHHPGPYTVVAHHPTTVIVPTILPVPAPQQTVTVWITNPNGSMTQVVLVREGPWYIGPRGERYFTMPGESELRPLYGLPCEPVVSDNINVWLTNQYGARIVVTLARTHDGFIGPKGELYHFMPTEDQLMMVYGR